MKMIVINAYLLQDYFAPSEDTIASEVSQREFHAWAVVNPDAPIEIDADNGFMYLCLNVTTSQGLAPAVPDGAIA